MKNISMLILVGLVGCASDTPPLEIPSPVFDGLTTEAVSALTAARDAVAADPDDAGRAGHYGMLLQAYRQVDAAGKMYAHATALAPDEFRWAYYHAYVLETQGDPEAALAAYESAMRVNPNYAPGHLRRAQLLLVQGQQAQAREAFVTLLKQKPEFTEAAVGLGQTLMAIEDNDKAQMVFERVLVMDSNNAKAHYGLAQIKRTLGDTEAAAEHLRLFEQYRAVTRLSPDRLLSEIGELNRSDRPSMQRARNAVSRGDVQGAIGHFEEAIRRNPGNAGARVSLVGLYAAADDFVSAEKHYKGALELAPDNFKLHFSFGFSQQRRGLHAEAIEMFNRALSLNPDDADSHAYLGVSQLALGERDAALASLQKAVALNPQQREGNARLGQVLLENGDAEDAIQYLANATRRDDRYSITYLILLAEAWRQMENPDEAGKARQRALGLARRFNDERADALAEPDE